MLAFLYDIVIIRDGFGASHSVSDTRAGLKDFLSGKKTTETTKSKLDKYLDDPLDEAGLDDDFDILVWWKLKSSKYSVMAKLTRDILAVPIFTVTSESTFSTFGRILSHARSSLNDESIETLICAQNWLRACVIGI
jgi:hAT family C-terminal dimerisation region